MDTEIIKNYQNRNREKTFNQGIYPRRMRKSLGLKMSAMWRDIGWVYSDDIKSMLYDLRKNGRF